MKREIFKSSISSVFADELAPISKLLKVHVVFTPHPDAFNYLRSYFTLSKNHYTSDIEFKEFRYKYAVKDTAIATVYTNNWMTPYLTIPKKCIRLLLHCFIEESNTRETSGVNREFYNTELTMYNTLEIEWNRNVTMQVNKLKVENIRFNIFSISDLVYYLKE